MHFTNNVLMFTQLVTESLPISSSSHVRMMHKLLTQRGHQVPALSEELELLLHIPTFFIVSAALWQWYGELVVPMVGSLVASSWRGRVVRAGAWRTGMAVALSTLVTVVAYLCMEKGVITCSWHISVGLAITAGLLFASNRADGNSTITWWQALLVGGAQAVALCPGVSRLGATYAVGRLCGWRPRRALSYSFLLQLTLIAGGVLRALLGGKLVSVSLSYGQMIVFGIASLISYGLLLGVMHLAQRRHLWWFGFYLLFSAFVF